ncbi:unnamed protein product, partial [marine sediment metagenome]
GKPEHFTSQDHNFNPGETVTKQIVVINNSRQTVTCDLTLSLQIDELFERNMEVTVKTGEQKRIPVRYPLPLDVKPGRYEPTLTARFSTGEVQKESFVLNVLPKTPKPEVDAKVALFDPKRQTARLLRRMGVRYKSVKSDADLADYDVLIIGKHALTLTEPKLDLSAVADGLKVIVFEQTTEVLEKRLGFRTQEYGLRRVFPRVPDHPILAGLDAEHLHDWRGEATTVPPRLQTDMSDQRDYARIQWCGFTTPRPWRCGCYGSVASALIEKPTSG